MYVAFVSLVSIIKDSALLVNRELMTNRTIFLLLFLLSVFLSTRLSKKWSDLLSVVLIYAGLSLLYKETAILNRLFYPARDPLLEKWDYALFGFQPALEFSRNFPYPIISEMLFFGYFSYYIMPLVILLLIFKKFPDKLMEFGFLLITSFLVYYSFFILFPAVGPQFFWDYPANYIEAKGLFGTLVKIIQLNGEAPTAAFPSSHVGISVILLLWLYRKSRVLFYGLIPTTILLILATVYIKAHYFVDVAAGVISAPVIYICVHNVYFYIRENFFRIG